MTCIICNKPATSTYSPDIDIHGLGTCDKHIEQVRLCYYLLITQCREAYQERLDKFKEEYK